MTRTALLRNWLVEPPVTGIWALVCAIAAAAIPTLIRASVDGVVIGCETNASYPAILLSAIFLGWRYTALVGLASAVIADALFMGPDHDHLFLGEVCTYGVGSFLAVAALIIGFVEAVRSIVRDFIREHPSGIVFSTADGQAWASWYDRSARVHLGTQQHVAEMMQDFLAQVELAKRLNSEARQGPVSSSLGARLEALIEYTVSYFQHDNAVSKPWTGSFLEAQAHAKHSVLLGHAERIEIRDKDGWLVFQYPIVLQGG